MPGAPEKIRTLASIGSLVLLSAGIVSEPNYSGAASLPLAINQNFRPAPRRNDWISLANRACVSSRASGARSKPGPAPRKRRSGARVSDGAGLAGAVQNARVLQ